MAEIRIGCGRVATYTDTLGRIWAADNSFVNGATFSNANAIANTLDPILFRSERYTDATSFSYSIPIANGAYTLNLGFAEIFYLAAGQSSVDIFLQGNQILFNYDVALDAGGVNRAIIKSFPLRVENGIVRLDFVSVIVNTGKISNIEIVPRYFASPQMLSAC